MVEDLKDMVINFPVGVSWANLFKSGFLEDSVVIRLIILSTRGRANVPEVEASSEDQHLSVTRVGFIQQTIFADSHNAIQHPHFFQVIGPEAETALKFAVKGFLDTSFIFVQVLGRANRSEIIAVHHHPDVAVWMVEMARASRAFDKPSGEKDTCIFCRPALGGV